MVLPSTGFLDDCPTYPCRPNAMQREAGADRANQLTPLSSDKFASVQLSAAQKLQHFSVDIGHTLIQEEPEKKNRSLPCACRLPIAIDRWNGRKVVRRLLFLLAPAICHAYGRHSVSVMLA